MKRVIFSALLLSAIHTISAQQNVGIGTTTPTEKLQVIGNIKADTIKPSALLFKTGAAADKVLTSDVNGNATWQPSAGLTLPYAKTQAASGALFSISNNSSITGVAISAVSTSSSINSAGIQGTSTLGRAAYFTSTAGKALETSGKLKFAGNGETVGAVLTSDATGVATWKTPEKMFFKASGFDVPFNVLADQSRILTDWSVVNYNIGGNSLFNNSQGDLFVLIAGLYRISVKVHCYHDNPNYDSEYDELAILINGSVKTRTFVPIPINSDFAVVNAQWIGVTATTVLQLNNQDKISFRFSKGGIGNSTAQFIPELLGKTYNEFTVEKIN